MFWITFPWWLSMWALLINLSFVWDSSVENSQFRSVHMLKLDYLVCCCLFSWFLYVFWWPAPSQIWSCWRSFPVLWAVSFFFLLKSDVCLTEGFLFQEIPFDFVFRFCITGVMFRKWSPVPMYSRILTTFLLSCLV